MADKKVTLEFQYFEGCPNHKRMSDNLSEAIKGLENKIELKKVLVEDEETAKKVNFRGSPTLLINGNDLLGMPIPDEPSLTCRFYANGIPSAIAIRDAILNALGE